MLSRMALVAAMRILHINALTFWVTTACVGTPAFAQDFKPRNISGEQASILIHELRGMPKTKILIYIAPLAPLPPEPPPKPSPSLSLDSSLPPVAAPLLDVVEPYHLNTELVGFARQLRNLLRAGGDQADIDFPSYSHGGGTGQVRIESYGARSQTIAKALDSALRSSKIQTHLWSTAKDSNVDRIDLYVEGRYRN
jgi:hypothetical protein